MKIRGGVIILYHFCPAGAAEDVRRQGLKLGQFPFLKGDSFKLLPGYQWLTTERIRSSRAGPLATSPATGEPRSG